MTISSFIHQLFVPIRVVLFWVLLILIALCAAKLTWVFVTPVAPIGTAIIEPANQTQTTDSFDWNELSQTISERPFFGEPEVIEPEFVEVVEVVEAPETKLNLSLQAVLAQGEGEGFAVIAQSSGSGKVFQLGDDVFGSSKLESVFSDRVILDRKGKLETLKFETSDSSDILQSVEVEPEIEETLQATIVKVNNELANGGDYQTQAQNVVNYLSQRASQNPQALLNELGLQANGDGYQVTRRARQLQMIGLRPGDLVTAINDTAVGNIVDDQSLFNNLLQTGGQVKVQIRRGSRSFTIYQIIPTF